MLNTKSKFIVKSFYNTFLGLLIKNGNRVSAKRLLDKAFFLLLKTTKLPFNLVILKIFLLLNTFVEVLKNTKNLVIKSHFQLH